MKVFILMLMSSISASVFAGDNNINNILNNNNGQIDSIEINQENTLTEQQVSAEEKIDKLFEQALELRKTSKTKSQINERNHIASFAGMASEVNKLSGTNEQKQRICKSRANGIVEIMGHKVDFYYGKCEEVFSVN